MPNGRSQPRSALVRFLVLAFALILGSRCFAASAPQAILLRAEETPVVRTALAQIYRMDYETAVETLTRGLPRSSPARAYFLGVACMNRFLDRGDTTALRRAEDHWEALNPRGKAPPVFAKIPPNTLRLFRGLAGMQLSFAAAERGQMVRSTLFAMAARNQLEDLDAPEARATLMLFRYYRSRLLEKVPFVQETAFDVPAFTAEVKDAPILGDMFRASLFWIHFDNKSYGDAERIAVEFLGQYPGNRLMRQMQAALWLRAGRLDESLALFESLRAEYAALPSGPGILPLGYYRNVGNLARVQAARGDRRAASRSSAEWRRADSLGLMPWLPGILKRELVGL